MVKTDCKRHKRKRSPRGFRMGIKFQRKSKVTERTNQEGLGASSWIQKHFHGLFFFIFKETQICIREVNKPDRTARKRRSWEATPAWASPAAPPPGRTSHSAQRPSRRLPSWPETPGRRVQAWGTFCSPSLKCPSHSCSSSPLRSRFPREVFPDHAVRSLPPSSFLGLRQSMTATWWPCDDGSVVSRSSGGRRPEIKVPAGPRLSGGCRGRIRSVPLSSALVVASKPWRSPACRSISLVSASITTWRWPLCVCVHVSLVRTPPMGSGPPST